MCFIGILCTMAFTKGYKWDIFLSYAKNDNGEEKWIDQFEKHIKSELTRNLGRSAKIKIFRDKNQSGNTKFSGNIPEQLKKAAVIVAVLSNNYLDSS